MIQSGFRSLRVLCDVMATPLLNRLEIRYLSTCKDKVQMLFSTQVEFSPSGNEKQGDRVSLEAIYQDSMPSGSPLGTVVAMHGSPGSHKDWKYITPLLQKEGIRMIGVNFPGFGLSEDLPQLKHVNIERNAFVEALLTNLSLRDKIVFMGHSRGAENALKLSARNTEATLGTVLVNSPGLRIHRGIRPFPVIKFLETIYEKVPVLRGPMHYFMHKYYNKIGLRTNSGRVAMNSVKTMANMALHRQAPFQKIVNENDHIRVLCVYACKDFLIEEQISREYSSEFRDRTHLVCKTNEEQEEAHAREEMRKAFLTDGRRTVTCEFVADGHFLQKFRAGFIADGIVAMLQAANKDK